MSHISVISRFDKSGQWLASIVPSLDIHKLRVHSTSENITLSLKAELDLDKSVKAICLEWIGLSSGGSSSSSGTKKRRASINTKASAASTSSYEQLVIAIGTNVGTVIVYSPSKGSVLTTLTVSSSPITSVSQVAGTSDIWITDGSNVSKWNLVTGRANKTLNSGLADGSVGLVKCLAGLSDYDSYLLLASTAALLVDPTVSSSESTVRSFSEFAYPITNMELLTSPPSVSGKSNSGLYFVTGSLNERMIVVNNLAQEKPANLLVAQANIRGLASSFSHSALAALTEDGSVEVFIDPLTPSKSAEKKRRSSGKGNGINSGSKLSDVHIKLVRPNSETPITVESVIFDRNYVVVVWYENGIIPVFEKVKWQNDDGSVLDSREVVVTKSRISSNLKTSSGNKVNGVDASAVLAYNESQAVVISGKDYQEVDNEELDYDDDENAKDSLADKLSALEVEHDGQSNSKKSSGLATNGNKKSTANGGAGFSTPGSFAVILSQALETNDHTLLETCLANREEGMIKVSVQRLKSALAVRLLERLAEKMGRSPTRTGQLNVWIKWVMICHGGYIVTIPNLVKSLSSLHYILSERVSALPKLIALEGRLEMLQSQIELRKEAKQKGHSTGFYEEQEDVSEAEEEVEYVEDDDEEFIVNGEEDFDGEGWDEEDDDEEDDDEEDDDDDENDDDGYISINAGDAAQEDEAAATYSDIEDDNMAEEDLDEDMSEEEVVIPVKKSGKGSKANSKNKRK